MSEKSYLELNKLTVADLASLEGFAGHCNICGAGVNSVSVYNSWEALIIPTTEGWRVLGADFDHFLQGDANSVLFPTPTAWLSFALLSLTYFTSHLSFINVVAITVSICACLRSLQSSRFCQLAQSSPGNKPRHQYDKFHNPIIRHH